MAKQSILQKISTIDVVNMFAIVVSLIYVGYEIRQNTNAVLSETNQSLITMAHENLRSLFDKEFATTVIRGTEDYSSLESLEKMQFDTHVRMLLDIWEHAFYSHETGIIQDELWRAWNASVSNEMDKPSWQEVWQQYHDSYGQEFQLHVKSLPGE